MKNKEFIRLMGYWQARRLQKQHATTTTTRRHNKRVAIGSGMILKNSSIRSEVQLETVFVNERYTSRLNNLPRITLNKKEITQQNNKTTNEAYEKARQIIGNPRQIIRSHNGNETIS